MMIRCNRPKRFGLSAAAAAVARSEKSNPEMEDRFKQAMALRAQQDAELSFGGTDDSEPLIQKSPHGSNSTSSEPKHQSSARSS